jgi:methylase of polypeptide subunit release factors
MLVNSGLSTERTEALAACENFKDTVKWAVEEFTDIIEQGSMKALERKVKNIADIQEAFERMGTRLFKLLNAGNQRDYEGDVGSGCVE